MLAPGKGATYNSNRASRRLSEVNPYIVSTGADTTPSETLVIVFVLVPFLKIGAGCSTIIILPWLFCGVPAVLVWVSNSIAVEQ